MANVSSFIDFAAEEFDERFLTESGLKLYHKYGPVVRQKFGPVNIVQLFDVKVGKSARLGFQKQREVNAF